MAADMLRAIAEYSKTDRAEDISKGVFVPVSDLPKKEPNKTERTAAGKAAVNQ